MKSPPKSSNPYDNEEEERKASKASNDSINKNEDDILNDPKLLAEIMGDAGFDNNETKDVLSKVQDSEKKMGVEELYSISRGNSRMIVAQGSVVNFKGDCIVNAANEGGTGGGFVDGAINDAGGEELIKARKALPVDENGIRIPTGEARITISGNLGSKWVAHAVGPRFLADADNEKQNQQLQSAYCNAIECAVSNGATSIGFALLSAGIFRGPRSLSNVLKLGWDAVAQWCLENPKKKIEAYFVAYKLDEKEELIHIAQTPPATGLAPSLFPAANQLEKRFKRHSYNDLQSKGIVESNNVSSKIHKNMRKLELAFRKDRMNDMLYTRAEREVLVEKGMLPPLNQSTRIEQAKKALQHQMMIDKMNGLLYSRPEKSELVKHGIIPGGKRSSIVEGRIKELAHHMKIDLLNALIYQRPERRELESKGILLRNRSGKRSSIVESSMKSLEHHMKMDQMNALLYSRPEKGELVARGILRAGTGSSQLERAKKELEHHMKIDQMNALLYSRPEREHLVSRGIIRSGRAGRRSSVVEGKAKTLEHNMKIDQMNALLYSRPNRSDLVERGIIQTIDHPEQQEYYQYNDPEYKHSEEDEQVRIYHLTRILLKNIAAMSQASKINLNQKGRLKSLILGDNTNIFAAAETFDMGNDLNVFEATLISLVV